MSEDDVAEGLFKAAADSEDLAKRAEAVAREAEILVAGVWRSDHERLQAAAKAASLRADATAARQTADDQAATLDAYIRAKGIKKADADRVLMGLTIIEVDAEGVAKVNYSTLSPDEQESVRQQAAARKHRQGW